MPGPARTGALGGGGPPAPGTPAPAAPCPKPPPHLAALTAASPFQPLAPPMVANLLISSLNLFMAGLYPFVYVPTLFFSLNSSFPSIIFPPPSVFQRAQSYLFSSCSGKKNLNYLTLGTLAGLAGCSKTERQIRFVPALGHCPCLGVLGGCCGYPEGKLRHWLQKGGPGPWSGSRDTQTRGWESHGALGAGRVCSPGWLCPAGAGVSG